MFDNFNVGPSSYVYGSLMADPVAYTPTFTGFGTVATSNISSWRDGAYVFGGEEHLRLARLLRLKLK